MRHYYLPLFWKFTIAIIAIVLMFGTINIILISSKIDQINDKELNEKNELIFNILSNQISDAIERNEENKIQNIIDDIYKSDSTFAFIIVRQQKPDRIFKAGSFDFDSMNYKESSQVQDFPVDTESILYKSTQILSEKHKITASVGINVHAGHEYSFYEMLPVIIMISVFLIIGIAGAFFFASVITHPIHQIIHLADKINLEPTGNNKSIMTVIRRKLLPFFNRHINVYDELDTLVSTFNNMVARLDEVYKEKEKSYNKLMQAEKMASIGTLTAGIAHEINNPIAGIQNCVRRIENNPDNYEQNSVYLDMMSDAIEKTQEVVKRLLDYSRTPDITFDRVDLYEVVRKSSMLISYKLEMHHISLLNNIPQNLPEIKANFNQLEQVFVNLFLNSIDAIEMRKQIETGFKLLIEVKARVDNSVLIIEVIDNGIGIEENDEKKVFDPFFTTKETGKGTGLGLFVCYSIIQSHNGIIKFSSKYKEGTKFTIELPITG